MSEAIPTNSELAQKIVGAVQAVQDAQAVLVQGARQLAEHAADTSSHGKWIKNIEGPLDLSDEEQIESATSDIPIGGIVAYDLCPDCNGSNDPVYINGQFNTREIITESGEWTAPVTGIYKITLISGGNGGIVIKHDFDSVANKQNFTADAGASGDSKTVYKYYQKGDNANLTVGAGGIGGIFASYDDVSSRDGGITAFDGISTKEWWEIGSRSQPGDLIYTENIHNVRANGGGFGGGISTTGKEGCAGRWYGAGGGVYYTTPPSTNRFVGDGCQGCVIVEYYDAAKDKNISIDMASSTTIADLQAQLVALTARVQELENE